MVNVSKQLIVSLRGKWFVTASNQVAKEIIIFFSCKYSLLSIQIWSFWTYVDLETKGTLVDCIALNLFNVEFITSWSKAYDIL